MGSAVEPEIAALAVVAASSLVGAVVQDSWTWAKGRVLALFGRGTREEDSDVEDQLAQARHRVRDAQVAGDEDAVVAITDEWAGRLQDLLAERPGAVPVVREIVGEALTRGNPAAASSALLHYVNNAALFRAMDGYWHTCREACAVTAVFLSGVPGVGKRSTARQWIHSHRDVLTGEVLQADLGLCGGRIADPAAILERWLDELDVPRADRSAEVPAMAQLVRRHLRDRPVVFLLENVTTTRQVRDLLTGQPYGVVLMTGQEAPHGLHNVLDFLPLQVPLLHDEHALQLLVKVSRTTEDPAKLEPIVRHVGGLPLALRLIAGQLKTPVPGVLEDITARLADRRTRQELLDVGDTNPLPEALEFAYQRMALRTAQLYRRLGLLMREDFQLDTVYALAPEWDLSEVRTALNALVSGGLVEHRGLDTYRLPALIHDHASIVAERDESESARDAVRQRIAHHFLRIAERGEETLSPRWRHDPMNAYTADTVPTAEEQADTLRELTRRQSGIFAAVRLAAESGLHMEAWRLSQATWTFCLRTGRHTEWIESRRIGLASALETGDTMAVARMSYELGFAHLDRWNVEENDPSLSREHFEQALSLVKPGRPDRSEGERRTESSILEGLALLERKLKRPERAIGLLARARAALEGIDHPRGHALLTFHMGRTYTALKRHDDAERELLRATQEFEELPAGPDRFNIAKTQLHLAEDRHARGRLREAVEALDSAVEGMKKAASAYYAAEALLLRGDVRLGLGERSRAVDDWTSAIALYREAGSSREDDARQRLEREDGEQT
ncbi:NB-ARC domain-containing protein [Streptomyces sp. NPDC002845]